MEGTAKAVAASARIAMNFILSVCIFKMKVGYEEFLIVTRSML